MMARRNFSETPTLTYLIEGLTSENLSVDVSVAALRIDSRTVEPSDVFIAIEGSNTDGSKYINDAIKRGAVAVLVNANCGFDSVLATEVPIIKVLDLPSRLGVIASRFYDHPSRHLAITGITGTNGKTSIAYYLAQALSQGGTQPVGSIGTLGYGEFGKLVPSVNTTPDGITIQHILSSFRSKKIKNVVMEVSSHGLSQGRVNDILFKTAIFTNLSRDHLDYHGDMSMYAAEKRKLFMMPGLTNAIINLDDTFGQVLIKEFGQQLNIISYGLADRTLPRSSTGPTIEAALKKQQINSLLLSINSPWGSGELETKLTGKFNAYNLLATVADLCLRDIPFDTVLHMLSRVQAVPGRMEFFGNADSARIIVDYAHTPDALKQALETLREQCPGKLVCVFGCGGDRDKGKRAEMGRISEKFSDRIILTSDNPRTEPPEQIIADILTGMTGRIPVTVEPDRALAIRSAIIKSSKKDIILIAGKGHETYQEVMTKKLPFSDRQLVRNILEQSI